MHKNITIVSAIAVILAIASIVHYATTKPDHIADNDNMVATTTTPTPPQIIAAYNQGKAEGQNAMRNAIVLEVANKGEVNIPFKVEFKDDEGKVTKVEDRTLILIQKPDGEPTEPTK